MQAAEGPAADDEIFLHCKGMSVLADIVLAIHVVLVCFMVYAPLFGEPSVLVLAEAGYVLLFLHWLLNNDACALTMLEQRLRGVEKSGSFIHSVVSPVYNIGASQAGALVWLISIALFAYGAYRLRKVYVGMRKV